MEARVTGGVEPYSLSWSNPNFNGNMIEAIEGGLYYLTVTDAEGSKAQSSINIPKIDPLIVTAFVEAAASTDQENGRARVEVQGGTSSYSYSWSNGESTANATNLAPGTHTVTVTDANGCTEQASVTIDENILALQTSLDITSNIACHGAGTGAIEASVAGGKGPFTYQWNEDALQGTQLSGLSGGTYSLTVTDAVGNQATASATIVEPELLQAEVIDIRGSTDESTNDGIASISVSGGTKPYSIAWDNGANTERVTNLSVGSHSVTITDAKGCEVSQDFEINKKILPQLTMSKLREGQLVQMQMLQFDADSTSINDGAKPILDEVYLFLKDNPGVVIRVEGHTNNIPPDEFCDNLSTARAKSVAEYIVQQGIAGERVYYRGYGKRQPRFSNLTPEGRRKNQRVEINIVSISDDS
jgi:outer membrane protein OmpA-like peptidoglycan-associated protein